MTLYIAICDDNAAQRKQTERLLGREKDSRLKTSGDVLYIESFGSSEALLKTPIKYDMFFIDVTNESQNGMDIAAILREKGIVAPIVMISSTINYIDISLELSTLYHVEAPITQNTISLMIDKAMEWATKKPSFLEIRCQQNTHYISPEDIVCARFSQSLITSVTLSDGSVLDMTDSLLNFYKMCYLYGDYIFLDKSVVNTKYIETVKGCTIFLKNGETIRFSLLYKKRVSTRLKNLK